MDEIKRVTGVELWGGIECTVNRVADQYFDQMARSGHWQRHSDLDLLAHLGLRKLRYPVLWELTAPEPDLRKADWSWPDARLARLTDLGIDPIVGLVHHGSGPKHTNLLDEGFSQGLAAYARACAERFPWVRDYTPVNEPLTTARFSALYGVWYPHAHDYRSLARALVNQCRATVLAMQQIRRVNPQARLIQTEDLGTITSTEPLAAQAAFENERRWLSLDLLCGRVSPQHPLYKLMRQGVSERDLAFFQENPCPPDVIGLNYYVTSDRFLDHQLEKYPPHLHGGNGRQAYADIESVRAPSGIVGHAAALTAAWERYGLPLAITEVHLDCHREDQLRWFRDAWQAAVDLRRQGADVRAVTLWSLLGAYDWNSLCTRDNGYYESGAFDLRSPQPRPTALAHAAKMVAARGTFDHPVLAGHGWWQREVRTMDDHHRSQYELQSRGFARELNESGKALPKLDAQPKSVGRRGGLPCPQPGNRRPWLHVVREDEGQDGQPLLITGASGTLGRAFARACEARGLNYVLLSRRQMDIADPGDVAQTLDNVQPWAIINTAGYVRVDDAEREKERCFRENCRGPQVLARAAAERALPLVTFSSDLVFAGRPDLPYDEGDTPRPLNVYGESKARAEQLVYDAHPQALIIRTSAFFSPWDPHNFIAHAMRGWQEARPSAAIADVVVSPTYVPDLVRVTLDLLIDGEGGIWHLANQGALTWSNALAKVASVLGYPAHFVEPKQLQEFNFAAKRPQACALISRRGKLMPSFDDAIERFVKDAALTSYREPSAVGIEGVTS